MKKFRRKVLDMLMSNNSGSSLRQQLLDGAPFCSELLYTAVPQRAASGTTGTFTRATTSTWPNNDGYMVTGVAGEIGFVGARRVRNLLTYSEDLSNAIWTKNSASITGTTQIVEAAANAQHYILQAANFTSGKVYILQGKVKSNGRRYCVLNLSISAFPAATSVFFDLQLGTLTSTGAGAASGTISSADSNGFYTITIKATANATASANAALYLSSAQDSTAAYLGDGASGIYAKDFQLEDVTAQTTQTAGEYVSVGVPSDWQGTELVTNGTFDTDTTWIKEAGWTIGGGVATHAAGVSATLYQGFNFVAGTTYVFSWDTVISAGAVSLRVGSAYLVPIDFKSASGTYTATYTAVTTATDLLGFVCDAPFAGTIDNFSVKPAYYHGSMVDGVKCFPTDLAGNALPTSYTYDAVSLNGVAGTYVSTPDSVANSVTGDIDIRCEYSGDWTPSAVTVWGGKFLNSGQYSWRVYTDTSGTKWHFQYSIDGTAAPEVSVTATAPFADNVVGWWRVTRESVTGYVNFYTSPDGAAWTPLGTQQTGSAGALYNGTDPVQFGTSAFPLSGKIYRAQIYNGINGTLAVDFDASRYAGGTTLTGSTGETWTLQGNAVIHPTNSPMLGYQAEGARTNLTIWNRDLTNAAWTRRSGTVTTALTAVGADGAANSATAVRNLGAPGVDDLYQTAAYAVTAGVRVEPSLSLRAVSTSGTLRFANAYDVGASGAWNIDLSLVSTTRMERITRNHPSVTITSEWVGGSLNFVQPIFDTTTGPLNFDVDLIQVELGSFASSPIATTTAAVTRNADVLTYSSAGNIDGTKGWCYAEATPYANNADTNNYYIADSAGASVPLYSNGVDGNAVIYDQTNAAIKGGTTFVNTPFKCASTWGGSSISVTSRGQSPASAAFDGDMGPFTSLYIGVTSGGSSLWGSIKNVRIGQRQLSASELGAITS